MAVGIWGKIMLGPYISLIADNSTNAPYVLIGTGTVIVVFGLFGCFATCRGSPWMLKLVTGDRRDGRGRREQGSGGGGGRRRVGQGREGEGLKAGTGGRRRRM